MLSQISPGPLSKEHANLEGISNCTQCHELGARVTNAKCLDCHTEIKSLITEDRGFHANSRVEIQSCSKCHSEHHGRNFDLIRFDTKNFNHNDTGYRLEGAHASVDCRECHRSQNIKDPKLKRDTDTYLGLDKQCLSCHENFHQGTLSTNCLECHSMDAFSPVTKFNHEEADFKLRGQHITVDCKECHETTTRNGREFQQFTGMAFNDCKSCHSDPHQNQLPGACTQCHVENSFEMFTGRGNFNHNRTDFELKGQHKNIDCFSCHDANRGVTSIFQDRNNVDENNCVSCHSDPHENKFGQDCAKCHNEESFLALNDMDFFDHSVTDYPLEGKHTSVDCRACHENSFANPIDFSECKNCHDDYHEGDFAENGVSPDCVACHTLEDGFEFTTFTIEDHNRSEFPLEGAHVATPCFSCHVSEDDDHWEFANLGKRCVDCHLDIHEEYIPQSYYPEDDCASCHNSASWASVSFDHSQTDWPLTGRHSSISCNECHIKKDENSNKIVQNFSNLETNCASCHDDVHNSSFAINGVTNCDRCHVTASWIPEKFDHDTTRFPLEGKHEEVECRLCHEVRNASGERTVIYKLNKLDCIDCHI